MNSVDVKKVIGESKFNRNHFVVLSILGFIYMFEGLDVILYGSVISKVMEEWGLTAVQAGAIGSYGLGAMLIGSLVFGPLSDKWGRKTVLLITMTIFSISTFLMAFSPGITSFTIFRIIAGIGFGGTVPIVYSLASEFSPNTHKGTMVAIVSSFFSLGGVIASLVAIYIIPSFHWQNVFAVAVIPILIFPIILKKLPESPEFLALKNQTEKLNQILPKFNVDFVPGPNQTYILSGNQKNSNSSVLQIFKGGRSISTVAIWVAFIMLQLLAYGLNTWTPKLMAQAGNSLESSIGFLLVLNLGAMIGGIFGGMFSDRGNAKKVIILYYMTAAVSLVALGVKSNMFILYLLIFLVGAAANGGSFVVNGYVPQYYPANIRTTGVGWAVGVAKIGAFMGPLLGGILISYNLTPIQNFLFIAIPAILTAGAILLVQEKYSARKKVEILPEETIKTFN